MKRKLSLVLVLSLVFTLFAVSAHAQDDLRVALIMPGSISDQGFNQSAYEGLLRIEGELGLEVAFTEQTPVENFQRVYRDFADEEFDVIIGHGFQFGDVTLEIAPEYPDVIFIVTNSPGPGGDVEIPENVAFIQPRSWNSAFLAGAVAGITTESNIIGALGGFDFPVVVAQIEAFRLGVKAVNPDAEVRPVYLGTFFDAAIGKDSADALIAEGADLIYHIADSAGLGAIQSAEENDVWVIGWGIDQFEVAPDIMVTTQIVDTGEMLVVQIQDILDGNFQSGPRFFEFPSGVVGYGTVNPVFADAYTPYMDSLVNAMNEGLIVVPFMPEDGLSESRPGGWLATPEMMMMEDME